MGKVIAIDGPSGAGKTTVAKLIAKELGFKYLDTGALYRAVAFALRRNGIDPKDGDGKLLDILTRTHITFRNEKIFLNGRDVSEEIRSTEVDHYSSVFSTRRIVRDFLLDAQRDTASKNDLVVEGRDTTTVVFPKAWKKVYLDASLEERAKRRCLQFRENGLVLSMDECRRNVIERDERDSNRSIAPLKRADDALLIDSSNLSVGEVVNKILEFVRAER
ncbi:MAG: (d)CMP kinase [Nitrospirota bacterium]